MATHAFRSFQLKFLIRGIPADARKVVGDALGQIRGTSGEDELRAAFALADERLGGSIENIARHMRAGAGDDSNYWVYFFWLSETFPDAAAISELNRILGRRTEVHEPATSQSSQSTISTPNITSLFDRRRYENDLHYTSQTVSVLGRHQEQTILRDFLTDDRAFCWLQLAGVAGQGKSRLAFELAVEAENQQWDAGFLSDKGLSAFQDAAAVWQPRRPTLIVIDYVLGREQLVGAVFDTLLERNDFEAPVRLLLLERQRWDRGGLTQFTTRDELGRVHAEFQLLESGRARWFTDVLSDSSPNGSLLSNGRFRTGVVSLERLDSSNLIAIIKYVLVQHGKHDLAPSDDQIQELLNRIDKGGRPLFAYLLALKLLDNEFAEEWTREDLLTAALEREQKMRWVVAAQAARHRRPSLNDNCPSMRLARLATMIDGLHIDAAESVFLGEQWHPTHDDVEEALLLVDGPTGSGAPMAGYIPPLQPDLLGEWFVLWAFTSSVMGGELLARIAWKASPQEMASFLSRCIRDFPNHAQTYRILNSVPDIKGIRANTVADLVMDLINSKVDSYPPELMKQLEDAAYKTRTARAMRVLGYCKNHGIWFSENPFEAFELFDAAAKAGDPVAMFNLSLAYHNAWGTKHNAQEAITWCERAAEARNIDAMFNLGMRYSDGVGVKRDPHQALKWFHRAAEAGNRDAMYFAAYSYMSGSGTKRDVQMAVNWYWKAAEAGNSLAMINLSQLPQDAVAAPTPQQTLKWLEAADIGDADAMHALGVCYEKGFGVERDPQKAFAWYHAAAKATHANAMYSLGGCYLAGVGVKPDWRASATWFRKALNVAGTEKIAGRKLSVFEAFSPEARFRIWGRYRRIVLHSLINIIYLLGSLHRLLRSRSS